MQDEDEPEKFHSIVIFLDDFSHMRANDKEDDDDESSDDDDAPRIVQLYSETDDEKDENEEGAGAEGKDDQASAKEERPSMYNCPNVGFCGGFENDIDNSVCVVCEHPRPPMEQLIAEHMAKLKADQA